MRNCILSCTVAASVFFLVGCGSTGGHCCNNSGLAGLGEAVLPYGPAALFDGNATVKRVVRSSGTVAGQNAGNSGSLKVDAENLKFMFDCNRSYNQDDVNITITDCAWTFSDTSNCLDKNSSTGKIVSVIYSCNESVVDGNLTVGLKVTDELNQTAESNELLVIKKNEDNITVTNRLDQVTTLKISLD